MYWNNRRWYGWGDLSDGATGQDEAAFLAHVGRRLGPGSPGDPSPGGLVPPVPTETRLSGAARAELETAVGPPNLHRDPVSRVFHAVGRSYRDLIRLRTGRVTDFPDAVATPEDEAQVLGVLEWAVKWNVGVVPFGGGTSVVGGVEALGKDGATGVVSLDLCRLKKVLALEERNLTVTAQAGITGPELDAALLPNGFFLGHYPESFMFSTLGGWIAARGAGQQSTRYGKIEDMVLGLRLASPAGVLETTHLPAMAEGPDARAMLVGSEGALGVIVSATLRLLHRPEKVVFRSWMFPEFGAAVEALRGMVQTGLRPGIVRLLDAEETDGALALLGHRRGALRSAVVGAGLAVLSMKGYESGRRSLLMVSFEGDSGLAGREAALAGQLARRNGGFPLGSGPGALWLRRRFQNPYLRDVLMDHGVFIDTLETATGWDALHDLHRDVKRAVGVAMEAHGTPGYVMAHLSHVYPSGASLYFILVTRQLRGREEQQWADLKRAATDTIVRSGAAVSHHHGIGLDHRPWFETAPGRDARALLCRLKAELDPTGVMNPGKLVPAPRPGRPPREPAS